MNSSKAHLISFREALSKCPISAFLLGGWVLAFLCYTLAALGDSFSQNGYAYSGSLLFFLNVIWYFIRTPDDIFDRDVNNFFFGWAFYTSVNGILGKFNWMNYNSRTLLFEFSVMSIVSFLVISSYRRVNV